MAIYAMPQYAITPPLPPNKVWVCMAGRLGRARVRWPRHYIYFFISIYFYCVCHDFSQRLLMPHDYHATPPLRHYFCRLIFAPSADADTPHLPRRHGPLIYASSPFRDIAAYAARRHAVTPFIWMHFSYEGMLAYGFAYITTPAAACWPLRYT